MSGRMSRNKGKRGERAAAKLLSDLLGIEWRRSQQVKGTETSSDIEPANGESCKLWPEVKRDETTVSVKMYKTLKTAKEECGDNVPFVVSRRNNEEWVIAVSADRFIDLCEEVVRILSNEG